MTTSAWNDRSDIQVEEKTLNWSAIFAVLVYKCSAVAEMGDFLTTIDMGQKLDGCAPFWGGAGSPSSTMSPGPRPTSVPSGILIHPVVWPQLTWAEDWGWGACALWSRRHCARWGPSSTPKNGHSRPIFGPCLL